MTDGRANVSRDGSAGRAEAEAEAREAARQLRAAGIPALVIDTSPRPQPQAEKIASDMNARSAPPLLMRRCCRGAGANDHAGRMITRASRGRAAAFARHARSVFPAGCRGRD